MVDYVKEGENNSSDKVLAISHCNCPERAQMVKEALLERMQVKDVIVLDTAGVSSMYANDGGIIVVLELYRRQQAKRFKNLLCF